MTRKASSPATQCAGLVDLVPGTWNEEWRMRHIGGAGPEPARCARIGQHVVGGKLYCHQHVEPALSVSAIEVSILAGFRAQIETLMTAQHLSLHDLSACLGMSDRRLDALLSQLGANLNMRTIARICHTLGATPSISADVGR